MIYSKWWVSFLLCSLLLLAILTFRELPLSFHTARDSGVHYMEHGLKETGVVNQVTAILLDYRGFDTLGEATVIFAAASIIGYFAPRKRAPMLGVRLSELVRYGVALMLPYLLIFGFYIILFGHLSPGGGFTGGVMLATTVIVFDLVFGFGKGRAQLFTYETKKRIEHLGLIMFILIGMAGVFLDGSFLANSEYLISRGIPGRFFSGGWIPLLNVASGLKVGAGLGIIFNNLVKGN